MIDVLLNGKGLYMCGNFPKNYRSLQNQLGLGKVQFYRRYSRCTKRNSEGAWHFGDIGEIIEFISVGVTRSYKLG